MAGMVRKIHYCWFGSPLPANVAANIEAWRTLNPDFEIQQWNEGNIDVSAYAFGRQILQNRRWGYLVDIVRLQTLYSEGGVYLDADVELFRPLSALAEEGDSLTLGYMYDCSLGAAVIYSPPAHPLIGELLEEYHHIRPGLWPVSNTVFTDFFINRVAGFRLNGRRWRSATARLSVHPKEFFEQPAFVREHGMSLHHCWGSWMPKNAGSAFSLDVGAGGLSHKVKWGKRKLRTFGSLLLSEYRSTYLHALLGRAVPKASPWRQEGRA